MFDSDFLRKVIIFIAMIIYNFCTMPPPQAVLSTEVGHSIIVGIKQRQKNLLNSQKPCKGCRWIKF